MNHNFKQKKLINTVFGTATVVGNIIWKHYDLKKNSFYIAIGICKGPINSINKILVNNKNVINKISFEAHFGKYDQKQSYIMSQYTSTKECYKGLSYIVLELNQILKQDTPVYEIEKELKDILFEFNVTRLLEEKHLQQTNKIKTKDKISAVVLGPSSGEFIYDTTIQHKITQNNQIPINVQPKQNQSDSIINIKYLRKELKNLKWVCITVAWYINSLNVKNCTITPKVEYIDGYSRIDWTVSSYYRNSQCLITQVKKLDYKNKIELLLPADGGTPADSSIINYIQKLKEQGYKIMLKPCIKVDTQNKGNIRELTGKAEHIKEFFNKQQGYKNFIRHYAKIAGITKIDCLLIGSQLQGLTQVHKIEKNKITYPAIDELCNIAIEIKTLFKLNDRKTLISYAAHWSEYNKNNGWYNMDKLWSLEEIDFVGIDAFFPLTYTTDSNNAQIQWDKGIHYDYILDNEKITHCKKEDACKKIKLWWESYHINPDQNKTNWKPKLKKIWFTSFGFASIDKSTNNPEILINQDTKNFPYLSSKEEDCTIQEEAINTTLDYFNLSEFIENMFLYYWDVRYPFVEEERLAISHSINGKLNNIPISDILVYLSNMSYKNNSINNQTDKIHLSKETNKLIRGIIIEKEVTIREIIFSLLQCYNLQSTIKPNHLFGYNASLSQKNDQVHNILYGQLLNCKEKIIDKIITLDNIVELINIENEAEKNCIITENYTYNPEYKTFLEQDIKANNFNRNLKNKITFDKIKIIMSDTRTLSLEEELLYQYKQKYRYISLYITNEKIILPSSTIKFTGYQENPLYINVITNKTEQNMQKIQGIVFK